MYFLSRTNKLYSTLVRIRPMYRYIITAIAFFGTVYSWLFFVYFPTQNSIFFMHKTIMQLHQQHLKAEPFQRICIDLESSVKTLQHSLQNHFTQETEKNRLQSMMFFIVEQAKVAGLSLQACSALDTSSTKWCTQHTTQFDIQGSLSQMTSFLNILQKSDYMIQAHQINIASIGVDRYSFACLLYLLMPDKNKAL